MKHYNIVIIGGGPGGYEVAARAAAAGSSVALFEKDYLGGTCLNRGCIPTKCMCAAAARILDIGSVGEFGIGVSEVKADYGQAKRRADGIVADLRADISASLSGVEVINAEASLKGGGVVEAAGTEYSADTILIASGSRPAQLRCAGAEYAIDSDMLLASESLPAGPVAIVGGGVIGLEFASVLNAFGVDVTVFEYCKEVLPGVDAELAKRLRTSLSRRGVGFVLGAAVEEIGADRTVSYSTRKGKDTFAAGTVLAAVGRRPVLPQGLDAAGVRLDGRGFIAVDPATMATSAPGIYAAGDVNGLCMLAHAASAQAKVALGFSQSLSVVPAVVFTEPELATVGLTVEAARELYPQAMARKVPYAANGKALAEGHGSGLLKLVCDGDSGRILGCHVVGSHAADLVAEAAVVIAAGMTCGDLARVVHAHPSLSELLLAAL